MSDQVRSSLGIKSEIRPEGTLRLSLETTPLEAPGPDEVLVEMVAVPLHPADIGLLLGPADLSTGTISGEGESRSIVLQIAPERMPGLAPRVGRSLPVGNEGSGIVLAAGERHRDLVGKPVAVMGGAMVTRHRVVPSKHFLPIPDGIPVENGAAVLTNPLTALSMLETMRAQGHTALVHTAAASSLGQMLNRLCLKDNVPLVNVVRKPEQAETLRSQGAVHVCDSSSATFLADLDAQIAATGATLAFDAVGGGKLASQILSAMERQLLDQSGEYSRYGSKVLKQLYFYGGLDTRVSELDRAYGMTWSVGGWLFFDELDRMRNDRLEAMRTRISAEMGTTFATSFAGELSMTDLMDPDRLQVIAARRTGAKYLINPQTALA